MYKDNRCGQCGAPYKSRQHGYPVGTAECQNCRKKGHYEKMCRLPKKIQYVDKASSSADEDNWDYNKIQSINNNNNNNNKNNNNNNKKKKKKKKRDYFHATLLVNDLPIKFIIQSGSPVALIYQRLSNDISDVTILNTSYKDENNNKIEFLGKPRATVKTKNNTSTTSANYQSKYSTVIGRIGKSGLELHLTQQPTVIKNIILKWMVPKRYS